MDSKNVETRSKSVEKNSKGRTMTALVLTAVTVRVLVESFGRDMPKKCAIHRAGREVGISERRAKALYYDEARRVDGEELRSIQHVSAKYAAKFEAQATRLEAVDPDMFGAEISRLRAQAKQLRALVD